MQKMQPWSDPSALAELVAFVAVAEQGSFKGAARQVGRDPTVLSRRLDALERRLGARLLERSTRSVSLSEAGALLLERARSILAALRDAEEELRAQAGDEPVGRLRLALPSTFARLWIAPVLPEFLAAHPNLRVEVQLTNRYVDLAREGFDAAIRIGELPSSSLVARKLATLTRLLCAAPSYVRDRGSPRHPHELVGHDTLVFAGSASFPLWRLQAGAERATVRLDGRYVSDDAEALRDAALAGLGIMMATDWLVGRELAEGRLVRVLPRWSTADRAAIFAVIPNARLVPRKTRLFLDWISARFAKPPWLRRA